MRLRLRRRTPRPRSAAVVRASPPGHYVLADVYNRQGQAGKALEEVGKAQRLEAALRKNPAPRL